MHEVVGSRLVMESDLAKIRSDWEDEQRPEAVKLEHKLRSQRIQDREY